MVMHNILIMNSNPDPHIFISEILCSPLVVSSDKIYMRHKYFFFRILMNRQDLQPRAPMFPFRVVAPRGHWVQN